MPNEEQVPHKEKDNDMSFSDWKKMKSALNSCEESRTKPPGNAKSKKVGEGINCSSKNYNYSWQKNGINRSPNSNYKDQQRLQNVDNLNQRYSRNLNIASNMGSFLSNELLMIQLNNMGRNHIMGTYNNNIGAFNKIHNIGPFSTNRNPYNNMGQFNQNLYTHNNINQLRNSVTPFNSNNLMHPVPLMHQRIAQRNLQNNRKFTDTYMRKNNSYISVSDMPIPQMQTINLDKTCPLSMPIQKRGVNGKKASDVKTPNDGQANVTNIKCFESNVTHDQSSGTSTSRQKKNEALKQKGGPAPVKQCFIASTPEIHMQMRREYRQRVKQVKNKDFLNAKRVIQRLKKKSFEELDEKEKERWEKANDIVNSHKKMLTEKAMARGESAATTQKSMISEKNLIKSPGPADTSSPLNNYNNDNICKNEENSSELLATSIAAETGATSDNWELWNSFVPGEVLFKS